MTFIKIFDTQWGSGQLTLTTGVPERGGKVALDALFTGVS